MAHDVKLGQLIEGEQERDAVHIAVAPVVAAVALKPGDHIGFTGNNTEQVGHSAHPIGIVDPFLKQFVMQGEKFFMFLYPQTVTGMRHHWEHPAFKAEVKTQASTAEKWLQGFADEVGVSYMELMVAADGWLKSRDVYTLGDDTPTVVYEKKAEFWENWEVVTGRSAPDKEATFFRCDC